MTFNFDGVNKIITPTDPPVMGTINIDVRDIYSRWIDWLLTSDNSKYLPAMRNVGGDPLPGSKQLGITYFLLNGWKIRPYEATHTFTINGNMYSEDGTSPFVPTLGFFNVTIISSVSNLVDSTVQQLPEIEYASYNGGVTIDAVNGTDSSEYPYGTPLYPCKTPANSYAIRTARGFNKVYVKSDLLLSNIPDGVLSGLEIIGVVGYRKNTITIDNCLVVDCTVRNMEATGTFKNGSYAIADNCMIHDASNINLQAQNSTIIGGRYSNTEFKKCVLTGDVNIFDGGVLSGTNIVFEGDFSTIDFEGNSGIVSLDIDSGYVKIINSIDPSNLVEVNMRGGEIEFDETCTDGEFYLEGYGILYNTSAMTVKANNLLSRDIWRQMMADNKQTGTVGKKLADSLSVGSFIALK